MKNRRVAKKRLKLSLSRTAKKSSKPKVAKIKEVALPVSGIVRVAVPSGVLPVVAIDPVKRVVEIIPVKQAKKTWWQSVFG